MITESLNAYLAEQGIPSVPYLKNCCADYLQTGRWQEIVRQTVAQELKACNLQETMNRYLEETIQPLIAARISAGLKQMEGQLYGQLEPEGIKKAPSGAARKDNAVGKSSGPL